MSTIGERIRDARKSLKKTQKEFAQALGFSENYVWQLEKNQREPSDRTISDICRVFGIREQWLRTGETPMKPQLSRNAEISRFVNQAMEGETETDTQRILAALMDATPEEIEAIASFARKIASQYTK